MALKNFAFNVLSEDKFARCGLIETHRGNIRTPAFMPVGTQATVKACKIEDIKKTGSDIILSNTYHVMIRPGVERIQSAGGLHSFMNCELPILTDSGGFQVMSLSKLNKIDREKGAIFNSHVDGKKFYYFASNKDLWKATKIALEKCENVIKDLPNKSSYIRYCYDGNYFYKGNYYSKNKYSDKGVLLIKGNLIENINPLYKRNFEKALNDFNNEKTQIAKAEPTVKPKKKVKVAKVEEPKQEEFKPKKTNYRRNQRYCCWRWCSFCVSM